MNGYEKRKTPRINSPNLLTYTCIDKNNHELSQGMGKTINISEGGILMETHIPLDSHNILSLTLGFEDELMDFKGEITFCKQRDESRYESGIQFIELEKKKIEFLKQFITIFRGETEVRE